MHLPLKCMRNRGIMEGDMITLPQPRFDGEISLEQTINTRTSIRSYSTEPINLGQLSQVAWAAQGLSSQSQQRTVPSAGAIYPLELYVVSGNVQDLVAGIYHYLPREHCLKMMVSGDKRRELAAAALNQGSIKQGAFSIIISAYYDKMAVRYGQRARRYVDIEVGHVGQNIYLQATALRLGTVAIGAFHDELVQRTLALSTDQAPLYIMPVGRIE